MSQTHPMSHLQSVSSFLFETCETQSAFNLHYVSNYSILCSPFHKISGRINSEVSTMWSIAFKKAAGDLVFFTLVVKWFECMS